MRCNDNAVFHFFLHLTDTIQDSFLICLHLRLAQLDQCDLYQDTLLRRIADLSGQFGENMNIADDLVHGKHRRFFLQIRQIVRRHIYDILQIVRRLYQHQIPQIPGKVRDELYQFSALHDNLFQQFNAA